jgi:hypothetical protein
MSRGKLNVSVMTDPSWWHWAATVPLLAAHLAGVEGVIQGAIGLCAAMSLWYLVRTGGLRPYPVQIRLAYLAMLLGGLVPGFAWLHAVQLIGTSAMIAVGYCALARALSLAPWNRSERLSWRLVRSAVLAPVAGGMWSPGTAGAAACEASCSLAARPQRSQVAKMPAV